MTHREHRVEFFSPGTLFAESSTKPIPSWDIPEACRMATSIQERHGAGPYGFRFRTVIVADAVDDGEGGTIDVPPKRVAESGLHHLGGDVLSYDEVPETEDNKILRGNMRCNDYAYVCQNRNSFLSTQPFAPEDVLVDPDSGEVILRGEDPKVMDYRIEFAKRREEYYAQLRTA